MSDAKSQSHLDRRRPNHARRRHMKCSGSSRSCSFPRNTLVVVVVIVGLFVLHFSSLSVVTAWMMTTTTTTTTTTTLRRATNNNNNNNDDDNDSSPKEARGASSDNHNSLIHKRTSYDLGIGKNQPVASSSSSGPDEPSTEIRSESSRSFSGDRRVTIQDGGGGDQPESLHHHNNGVARPDSPPNPVTAPDHVVTNWVAPDPVDKPNRLSSFSSDASPFLINIPSSPSSSSSSPFLGPPQRTRRMVARDNEGQLLRNALWDETHYRSRAMEEEAPPAEPTTTMTASSTYEYMGVEAGSAFQPVHQQPPQPQRPSKFYPDIDLSVPSSVYTDDGSVDLVWDLLRWEALQQAQREPLLLSFLHSTILNHRSLESSLAFLLANRLQSPAMMISTQLQSLIFDSLQSCPIFRRSVRADIMAVRDRDPACQYLPDVFLYFKGFHALQSHRVAHRMWRAGKHVLALYLQSQVSQIFQIDIHPNATLGAGIMLDHGTGIVIGETVRAVCFFLLGVEWMWVVHRLFWFGQSRSTLLGVRACSYPPPPLSNQQARVGHNCSILHHVTLGGSGKKGVIRHPQVGDGVLLGAGATVLGPVTIGDGTQVGAGTLVISDLPPHCVAVGVPARIIGSFVDVTQQPSIGMNQMIQQLDESSLITTFASDGI